jgi:hypothetical protein
MRMRWTTGVSRSPIEANRPVAGSHQFVFRSKSLKGTMNGLFLEDLAEKTRRGMRGRVEAGKSGGGICDGYRVSRSSRQIDAARSVRGVLPRVRKGTQPLSGVELHQFLLWPTGVQNPALSDDR